MLGPTAKSPNEPIQIESHDFLSKKMLEERYLESVYTVVVKAAPLLDAPTSLVSLGSVSLDNQVHGPGQK